MSNYAANFNPENDALNEQTAADYVNNLAIRNKFFAAEDQLEAKDLADGNVNLVFRVFAKNNPKKSLIVKQALPYARRYPDFKMPLQRAQLEFNVLTEHNKLAPSLAPAIYHFDEKLFINIMEDLKGLSIMREGMLSQTTYPNAAKDIGIFLGKTLFYTSDFYLDSATKKQNIVKFQNPVLTKITEDLIYTFPFTEHPTNRFPSSIKSQVLSMYEDSKVRAAATACKYEFMNHAEALLHGDLHTGSIMVGKDSTKIMDPEFAFYGPIAFDIAAVLANYCLASHTQSYHAKNNLKEFRSYLSNSVETIWQNFAKTFLDAFKSDANAEWKSSSFIDKFFAELEIKVIRHAACEMLRRTVGMAHILELDEIKDEQSVSDVSSSIVAAGVRLLTDSRPNVELFLKIMP
jgi:5-methylthioribose kinase